MDEKHVGSSLDDFLAEEGSHAEATAIALKRVLAWQIAEVMEKGGVSKTEMAKRMQTSRTALNRLLDPENCAVTLQTMGRAAAVLGKRLRVELDDPSGEAGRAGR
jgi:DNA-binding Xre family transcriptional regulator